MYSLIMHIAAKQLMPIFLFFSVIILLRGHNAPGGGFIGGLLAASAFILVAICCGPATARRITKVDPRTLFGLGLLLALLSALPSLLFNKPFKAMEFGIIKLPILGKILISTPFFFDVGVYLVVVGITLTIVYALSEES